MLRLGKENKKQLRWMIVLLAMAALAVLYDFRELVKTASSPPPGTTTNAALVKRSDTRQIDQQTRFPDLLLLNQQKAFTFGGRNIFRMQVTVIQSKKFPDTPVNPGGLQASTEQPSPSLPFTFYGFADKSSNSRWIFLKDNNGAFVTKVGDTVEGRYKVIRVSESSVTIKDVLRNYQQLVPLLPR